MATTVLDNPPESSDSMRPMPGKYRFISLPVFILFALVLCASTADADTLSLEGTHRFHGGDDPNWAHPALDESKWIPITVPGSLQSQNIVPVKSMGWYRIRFSIPESTRWTRPALMLGQVGNSDEVFLNGVKIGSEGVYGERFVDSCYRYQVYPVPEGLLNARGDNLLAVRVMNSYRQGGILGGPVRIGELSDLMAVKIQQEFARKTVEAGLFVFFFFFLLMSLFLYITGVSETEYLAFAAFISLYGVMSFLDSLIFYDSGFKIPLVQQAVNAIAAFVPAAGLFFLLTLYKMPLRLWSGGLMALYGVFSLGFLISLSLYFDSLLFEAWVWVALAGMGASLFVAFSARLKRRHESNPVLLAVACVVVGNIIEIMDFMDHRYSQNLPSSDFGLGLFFACIAYALISRHSRLRREVRMLSGRILDAHEEERKRLSREIHDGIGQALFSVKLHLDMLRAKAGAGAPVEEQAFSGVISEVLHSIGELRHVVLDLRPAVLEQASFVTALKWYGRKYSDQSGIRFQIEGDEALDPPLRRKDHLYRIFQEALSNIRRHAQADCVDVRVEKKGKLLSLRITDNGKGFDPVAAAERGRGLGLSTIRERAELLGGALTLKSSPGRGTIFHVEVPIE
jgi:signal transduction histidine kinase